jgi:hypothetical protein
MKGVQWRNSYGIFCARVFFVGNVFCRPGMYSRVGMDGTNKHLNIFLLNSPILSKIIYKEFRGAD